MTAANAQKIACAAPVDSRLMPKLSTITNASGENMMRYLSLETFKRLSHIELS